MQKIDKLINSLNRFIARIEKEDDITDVVPAFAGLDRLPKIIDEYEKVIARLLRDQRNLYVHALNSRFFKEDDINIESYLIYLKSDLFVSDTFAEKFGEETRKFLKLTIEELASIMMYTIDKDIQLEVLSESTTKWIEQWSRELAEIMQLNTHQAIENELIKAIQEGNSIQQAELRIKDLPQFDRNRARATARTEILTASSRAHYESFMQSPAVVMKQWKHSGSHKIQPRETHIAMNGVAIPVNEYFLVDGELGLYPRDTNFSAKNRVNCGCVIGPVVDEFILGLTKEQKEAIRQQTLMNLND